MKSIMIPDTLRKLNEIFLKNGFKAYLVGGAVRDVLLKKAASDWDITTNARPEQIMRIFHRVIPTGIAHGTVTIHFMGKEIEATTFRSESGYSDGRHPDSVSFDATLEDDLSRRDFTMNAIAASLTDGTLIDPFDGQRDIKSKIIRTVGESRDRFLEDGLRPIRAIRFSSQLNFEIEKNTYEAIRLPEVLQKISSISLERFRVEFEKILMTEEPSIALHRMEESGILKMFIPELAECRGCEQTDLRGFHEFDVLDHNLYACDGAPKDKLVVRLAALFHDVGKKPAKTIEKREFPAGSGSFTDIVHFYRHEEYSADIVRTVLPRLKFPNAVTDRVEHLVRQHMFHFEENWSDAAVRRFIVKVGKENLDDLLDLRLADMYGKYRRKAEHTSGGVKSLLALRDRISAIDSKNTALSLRDLAVNGKDLINSGIQPGKRMGAILNELFQCVLDDPAMNTKEQLLTVAKKLSEKK
ncbi:MAG: HD domain-containing protein [Treponema sp.]|uniref:CCA tRNA nucleotidyltransferase n=1 Tax=Treponema sp. TaxID=166 RepID=UPI0025DCEA76|nr:HD domain-containing protein [Treponema sp.]MBQ9281052.1 HD domain-containing protein [Treponema sp.]